MKKISYLLLFLLGTGMAAHAQHQYRLAKSTGQLRISLSNVTVEGYDGKEIIFEGEKVSVDETDERAKGLVAVTPNGYTDNTGLGISVSESGTEVTVNNVDKKPAQPIRIKVPQQMQVSVINGQSNYFVFSSSGGKTSSNTDEIVLKDLKGEIEVSVNNSKVRLENNTGPMNIKTLSGSVEAIFNEPVKGPVSIVSVLSFVDVALPAATKANLELSSNSGKIYAAKEFNIDFDKTVKSRDFDLAIASRPLQSRNVIAGTGKKVSDSTLTYSTTRGTQVKARDKTISASNSSGLYFSDNVMGTATSGNLNSLYFGGEKIKGKINGGGIDLILKSSKNIYLRQK